MQEAIDYATILPAAEQGGEFMRTYILVVCGMLVAGLAVSTQTPQAQPERPRPVTPAPASAGAAGSITVTGCLVTSDGKSAARGSHEAAPASASGSTGSATDAAYMLTNVQRGSSSASSRSQKSYVLEADSTVNLSAHLNHRVSVTGSVDKSAHNRSHATSEPGAAQPGPPPTDPPADTPAKARDAQRAHDMRAMKHETLKVTSVSMVSATCP